MCNKRKPCWRPRARKCRRWKAQFRQRRIASKFCWGSNPEHCRRNWPKPRRSPRSRRKCRSACLPNCSCAGPTSAVPNVNSPPRPRTSASRKSDLFPKFYLTGSVGSESISSSDWFTSGSRFWSVGPTVQWRILTPAASAPTSRSKTPGRNRRWPLTNKPC